MRGRDSERGKREGETGREGDKGGKALEEKEARVGDAARKVQGEKDTIWGVHPHHGTAMPISRTPNSWHLFRHSPKPWVPPPHPFRFVLYFITSHEAVITVYATSATL